jgi:hypothetical protein
MKRAVIDGVRRMDVGVIAIIRLLLVRTAVAAVLNLA